MADYVDTGLKKMGISMSKPVLGLVCLLSGVAVILFPALLVWIVGLFLVIQGALLLTEHFEQQRLVTPKTTSVGTYCHSCGARNGEEAVFCKRCGTKLSRTEQVVVAQPEEATQPAIQ